MNQRYYYILEWLQIQQHGCDVMRHLSSSKSANELLADIQKIQQQNVSPDLPLSVKLLQVK